MGGSNKDVKNLSIADKCKLTALILFEDRDFACINNEYYQYQLQGKNKGVWKKITFEYIEAISASVFESEIQQVPSTNNLKEVLRWLRNMSELTYENEIKLLNKKPLKNEVNLKDYILELDTMKIRDYQKSDFVFNKLPFNYKRSYSCPIFIRFLLQCFDDSRFNDDEDVLMFLQEWIGYCFLPNNKYEKCLIIYGDGGNGKGTLEGIITKIIGKSNTSNLDVSEINDLRHIERAKNKLVNFSTDLKYNQQVDTGNMKKAISGERVSFDTKYKKNGEFIYTAKNIIMCNDLPYVKNTGMSSRRRFDILEFRGFQYDKNKVDHDIKTKFNDEIEDIFNWAIEGLNRLIKNNKFTYPARIQKTLEQYMVDNDPVQQWIEECDLDIRDDDVEVRTLRANLYAGYRSYAKDSGYNPLNKKNFFNELNRKKFECRRFAEGYFYIGIKNPLISV